MQTKSSLIIPAAPALPASAPVIFEMHDFSTGKPVVTSTVDVRSKRGQDYVSQHPLYAAERGAAGWYRSDDRLTLGDFDFGVHLFVSHAGNTKSGTKPLEEVLISQVKRTWKGYPSAEHYDRKHTTVFPPAFKIVGKNAAGVVVTTFEMHDGLPINDPSIHSQGFPTKEKPLRPKYSCFNFLVWQNEIPRRSTCLEQVFAGMTEEGLRPSTAKSHYSVLGCEPLITGGYNRNSLNSLGNIWASPQWPLPKGSYWGVHAEKDPYFGYPDTAMDGRSAFMGPYVQGWDYEPGSYSSQLLYTAPGGPRFDRTPIASQLVLFATMPDGKRLDGGVPYESLAYGYSLAHANQHNKQVSDPTTLYWCDDQDILDSKKYYTGQYYGDGGGKGPNAIEFNGDQRDGTSDRHIDVNGDMPFNGYAKDGLHNGVTAAQSAMIFQSPMFAIMSKWDTSTSFMMHGPADQGPGSSYGVRDFAWDINQHVYAWMFGADHPLGFTQEAIEDRIAMKMSTVWRTIGAPCMSPTRDPNNYFLEGLARFGQPVLNNGDRLGMQGGGLAFYIAGGLMLMKQTGLWAILQARAGDCKAGLDFTVRNYCQYAFGVFGQSKATIWSNIWWWNEEKFADFSPIPKDWAELSAKMENTGEAFNIDANGNTMRGERDASVHPVIQFIFIMEDYFPEIKHPWKEDALKNVKMYLQRTTDLVKSGAGDTGKQRDLDYLFRVPGIAPIKPPKVLGQSPAVTLPEVPVMDTAKKPPPKVEGGSWILAGREGNKIIAEAGSIFRYGAGENWVVKEVAGEFVASNEFFGKDPVYGVAKYVEKFLADPVVVPPVIVEPTPVEPPIVVPPVVVEPPPVVTPPVEEPPVVVPPPVIEEPPVVIEPPTPTPPAEGASVAQAMVAAAIAFLESLGYKVTK